MTLGWLLVGLLAWFAFSVVTALVAGWILRRSGTRARDHERSTPRDV